MPDYRPIPRLARAARRAFPALITLPFLAGCDMVVMNPMGDIALQQRNLVIFATALMLLIVIPVMALVGIFAWKYRASNKEARYDPDWDHSTKLELLIWSAPLAIIICLGAVTWTATHLLDPYRPIARISKDKPVPADAKPLQVQVVSLDWKWLFIYPEYGFATVNELAAPVDRPIQFKLTSSSVMNAFYIPTLAGMIYTMPSMETQLNAVINKAGDYEGFSSNYSGAGFSGMRFRFHGMDDAAFNAWVGQNKSAKNSLSREAYLALAKPSEKVPVMRFGSVDSSLYDAIVNQCVKPGTTCMGHMMHMNPATPSGKEGTTGHAMPQEKQPQSPLTTGQAGGPPAANPADVQQRTPSSPDAQHIPGKHNH